MHRNAPNRIVCPLHTADATQLSSWVASASAVWTELTTSSRRLPTDSVNNLETDQTDYIAGWILEFWSIFITFSTMMSLTHCRHLSPTSTAQQHKKLGHNCRRLRSHRRRDSARQLSRVGVAGVYWALNFRNIPASYTQTSVHLTTNSRPMPVY